MGDISRSSIELIEKSYSMQYISITTLAQKIAFSYDLRFKTFCLYFRHMERRHNPDYSFRPHTSCPLCEKSFHVSTPYLTSPVPLSVECPSSATTVNILGASMLLKTVDPTSNLTLTFHQWINVDHQYILINVD